MKGIRSIFSSMHGKKKTKQKTKQHKKYSFVSKYKKDHCQF